MQWIELEIEKSIQELIQALTDLCLLQVKTQS